MKTQKTDSGFTDRVLGMFNRGEELTQTSIGRFKAAEGNRLPIFYKGSIIHIDDQNETEIDVSELEYEPLSQLVRALEEKQIFESGV